MPTTTSVVPNPVFKTAARRHPFFSPLLYSISLRVHRPYIAIFFDPSRPRGNGLSPPTTSHACSRRQVR
eukprot:4292225-Prymnesium_polylepis.1